MVLKDGKKYKNNIKDIKIIIIFFYIYVYD